jgi:Raf kinase inhibitor-like YbhB/YbcL family protein
MTAIDVPRRSHPALSCLLVAGLVVGASACNDDGRELREAGPDQTLSIITTTLAPATIDTIPPAIDPVATDAPNEDPPPTDDLPVVPDDDALAVAGFDVALPWPQGGAIDARYTCDGLDVSPTIGWVGLPENTVEVAIVVTDPDADEFVHWMTAGIDPSLDEVEEGTVPDTAIVAANDAGLTTWVGPCPPSGETHTYRFEVHALSQQVELPTGVPADEMLRAIDFSTIAMAVSTGTYTRP